MSITVRGKRFEWPDMKGGHYYHGTTADLPVGTVLVPGTKNFTQSADNAVSITNDPAVAARWASKVGADVHVYEVEPIGDVEPWRVTLANGGTAFDLLEGRTPKARIVSREAPR